MPFSCNILVNRSAPHWHSGMRHYEMPMWSIAILFSVQEGISGKDTPKRYVYCADGMLAGVQQTSGCFPSRLSLRDRTKK